MPNSLKLPKIYPFWRQEALEKVKIGVMELGNIYISNILVKNTQQMATNNSHSETEVRHSMGRFGEYKKVRNPE